MLNYWIRGTGETWGFDRGCVQMTASGGVFAMPHLCLMKGMLMQLAAATAAKGTKRLMIAGRCWGQEKRGKKSWFKKKSYIAIQQNFPFTGFSIIYIEYIRWMLTQPFLGTRPFLDRVEHRAKYSIISGHICLEWLQTTLTEMVSQPVITEEVKQK